MKTKYIAAFALALSLSVTASADQSAYPIAKVDYGDFKSLVSEVESHRAARLLSFEDFLTLSKEEGVVILDSRSKFRFDRIHLKGARHLNFSDFSQANLARVIPSHDTKILIYCNNNFDGNQVDFESKLAPRFRGWESPIKRQLAEQERPLMMALNIPTYINLYGYGYRNVYELHELVNVTDLRVQFEGSIVK